MQILHYLGLTKLESNDVQLNFKKKQMNLETGKYFSFSFFIPARVTNKTSSQQSKNGASITYKIMQNLQ